VLEHIGLYCVIKGRAIKVGYIPNLDELVDAGWFYDEDGQLIYCPACK